MILARALALGAGLTLAVFSRQAAADPQLSTGITLGAAGVGYDHQVWKQTDFHLGIRADLMLGRSKPGDFGIGPYAEVLTLAFDELHFGGGASVLLPVTDTFPFVASVGAFGRKGNDGLPVSFGVATDLFWGTRSYNFHASYVLTAGLYAQLRYDLGDPKETALLLGARVDSAMIALPFLFLVNVVRGGSHDTDPVR
jgi:hypothetical protein